MQVHNPLSTPYSSYTYFQMTFILWNMLSLGLAYGLLFATHIAVPFFTSASICIALCGLHLWSSTSITSSSKPYAEPTDDTLIPPTIPSITSYYPTSTIFHKKETRKKKIEEPLSKLKLNDLFWVLHVGLCLWTLGQNTLLTPYFIALPLTAPLILVLIELRILQILINKALWGLSYWQTTTSYSPAKNHVFLVIVQSPDNLHTHLSSYHHVIPHLVSETFGLHWLKWTSLLCTLQTTLSTSFLTYTPILVLISGILSAAECGLGFKLLQILTKFQTNKIATQLILKTSRSTLEDATSLRQFQTPEKITIQDPKSNGLFEEMHHLNPTIQEVTATIIEPFQAVPPNPPK